jgi:hypothetical protein
MLPILFEVILSVSSPFMRQDAYGGQQVTIDMRKDQ